MTIRRYPSKTFTPCPAGLHQAVCVDVVDLGEQTTLYGVKPLVRLVWQIADVDPATMRRYDAIKTCTDSMSPKATFRKLLESWMGRRFKEAEARAFDSDRLIGANCLLQVSQRTSDKNGEVYAAVEAVLPPVKGAVPLKPLDYVRRTTQSAGPTGTAMPSPPAAANTAAAVTAVTPPAVNPKTIVMTAPPHESEGLDSEFDEQGVADADRDDTDFIFGANDEEAEG